jgi:hypothetical protein
MFNRGKSLATSRCVRSAACAALAAVSLSTGALADPPRRELPANVSRPLAARVAKCICGYGVDGNEGFTCTPVKDCAWERGICRGKC